MISPAAPRCIDNIYWCTTAEEDEESCFITIFNLFRNDDKPENFLHDLCRAAFYELDDVELNENVNIRASLQEIRAWLKQNKGNTRHMGKAANYKGFNNWTPLHWLIHARAPCDLVEQLIHLAPSTVQQKNNQGSLPLHIACSAAAGSGTIASNSLEIIRMLVDAYPVGIDITDNMGETPVSILKRNGSATCADENGMLILHHACLDESFPIHAFRLLVEAFPEGINAADNQGRTPSNILNARASQRDANGMLLLHHQACSRSASINLFRLLFKACPESIASTDKRGMLPLHHACMNSGLLSLDIIQKFIHYYPESILFKVSE